METVDVLEALSRGEDGENQFKKDVHNATSFAAELVAMSNGPGGHIFIGVDDDGSVTGLSSKDVQRLNQLISNTASQHVQPPVTPRTNNVEVEEKIVLVVTVPSGINKPYHDKNGAFWVKCGADKRKATSREQIQRLFQSSSMVHADALPAPGITLSDLDLPYFSAFFQKRFGEALDGQQVPLSQTIVNMNLGDGEMLNLTGALLFGQAPSTRLPAFIVKAGAFPGTELATEHYIDSRDITGKMADVFLQTVSFLLANTKRIQGEQGINSAGQPEIPRVVFEELVANALVHRDYFISAPIRIFVFADRIEIISPGCLPNNLTVENIRAGNSNIRNPVLASFAYQLLPYRGFGSGILRALQAYPAIDFINDREGNLFTCIIKRNLAG